MNPYRVRTATLRDIPVLARQRRSMFVDMHTPSRKDLAVHDAAFPSWARREMRAGRLHCFLVEDRSGSVLGGGALWLREVQPYPGFGGGMVPYLMSMYTEPAHRGRGIATMIVEHAVAWSRSRGYGSITLHASKMGRPLYEKLGWEDGSEMELNLAGPPKQNSRVATRRSRRSAR